MKRDDLTYKEAFALCDYVGRVYRSCKGTTEVMKKNNMVASRRKEYEQQCDFVFLIESRLQKCSKRTREIIENDFLLEAEKGWYLRRYSSSTYYRLKAKALIEFLNCVVFD